MMRGVKGDKSHFSKIYAFLYLVDKLVGNVGMLHMRPPDKNVGLVKYLVGKTLILHIERSESDFKIFVLREKFFYKSVYSVGEQCFYVFFGFFM